MKPPTDALNPVELLDRLDPQLIEDRMGALQRELRALRVLWRAAQANERRSRPAVSPPQNGGVDA